MPGAGVFRTDRSIAKSPDELAGLQRLRQTRVGRDGNRTIQVHNRAPSAGTVAIWSANRSRHRLRHPQPHACLRKPEIRPPHGSHGMMPQRPPSLQIPIRAPRPQRGRQRPGRHPCADLLPGNRDQCPHEPDHPGERQQRKHRTPIADGSDAGGGPAVAQAEGSPASFGGLITSILRSGSCLLVTGYGNCRGRSRKRARHCPEFPLRWRRSGCPTATARRAAPRTGP